MLEVLLIVQARMGSTRLPGKVLMDLVPGKNLLTLLLDRLKISSTASEIVIATSDLTADDAIEALAKKENIRCFRGSESDVLGRFVGAAKQSTAEILVRLCADSPLHDCEVVDTCVSAFANQHKDLDYLSNMHPESYPYGMGVEVFKRETLRRLDQMTGELSMREHVTPLIYQKPELFVSKNVAFKRDLSGLRFAVDYPEDLQFVQKIYQNLYNSDPLFSWHSVVALLERESAIFDLNACRNDRVSPFLKDSSNT
jgi:spore coat polysaccharide biosynthesis protein SpsF (cytidylyltransferase family)